jgi:recombination protein RecT
MSTNQLKEAVSGEVATRQKNILDYLHDPKVEKGIAAVAGKFLTPDRFLRLAVNAVRKTPLLASCEPKSVLGAFMASAALGLEPNTIQQQAFLIPYKRNAKIGGDWVQIVECQFQVGYRGFVTLAHRSPYIVSIQAEAIHEGDLFEHMMGSDTFLKYRKALKDRGELIGSYCLTKLDSGIELATVLPLAEIHKIRSKSETYNSLLRKVAGANNEKEREREEKKLAETPWVMWEDDMSAKSAIKKHAKQLPLNPGDSLGAATAIDSSADTRTVDMAAMADPDVSRSVVEDGYEPPALENDPNEEAPRFNFSQEKEREPAQERQPAARQARKQTRQAPATESGLTYDQVAADLRGAKTLDALQVAADQIRDVADETERGDLQHIYSQRQAEFEAQDDAPPAQAPRSAGKPMSME